MTNEIVKVDTKMVMQCRKSASALGDFFPQTHYRAFPLDPLQLRDSRPPEPCFAASLNINIYYF